MSDTFFIRFLSFFITISILAFLFSLLTYNEGETVQRAINRRLHSLDHAVRLILQELENGFDHFGRARRRQVLQQADPATPPTTAEVLAAEQEARLAEQNEGRRWSISDYTSDTQDSAVAFRPANVSFSKWLEFQVPLDTPARDQIVAPRTRESRGSRRNLTNGTRSPSTRQCTQVISQDSQSILTNELSSTLRLLHPAPTSAQVDAILLNFTDLLRHRDENETQPLPTGFRQDLSFVLWLAIRQVEPRISEDQMDEILERFRIAYGE